MIDNTIPEVPAECFGTVEEANGMQSVPEAAPSLFPSGSPAGGSPRPEIGREGVGQSPSQGDEGFYSDCVNPSPTTPATYNAILANGTFRG